MSASALSQPGWALAAIAGALALGAISPGPSFLLVARTAMAVSRRAALGCALGMGLGSGLFALAALLGLRLLFAAVPWLFGACKFAGAAYLLYVAFKLWRGAAQPWTVAAEPMAAPGRAFWGALATQLSNPKTALVFTGVFAALLPAQRPLLFDIALPIVAFAVDGLWYAVVALGLSLPGPRQAYLRAKSSVDRVAGVLLGALAIRLATLRS